MSATADSKQLKSKHPIRENLDAFGIAILVAVLFKYFAIEAYQIPTSSMQPTMMGSSSAQVFDRILVDKSRYEFSEPARWDITVFRYPIRRSQNYVKRLVGLPGDRLHIAGGNVYQLTGDRIDVEQLEALRKPELVQESMWREVYPARRDSGVEKKVLGTFFRGRGGDWQETDTGLTVTPRRRATTLLFSSSYEGGLANRAYDGYAPDIASSIRGKDENDLENEKVQDAKLAFDLSPSENLRQLDIKLEVTHPDGRGYAFSLSAADGQGRLVAQRLQDGKETDQRTTSEAFEFGIDAGETTRVAFAHVDDRCIAWIDGSEVARLDTDEFKTLQSLTETEAVRLEATFGDGGRLALDDLRVWRDQHYSYSSSIARGVPKDRIYEVPEDRYLMLGDNTLFSVDSRDWRALEIGVDEQGRIVDPAKHPEARRLRGNFRASYLSENPDPDENPVPVVSRGKVIFTDELGQVRALDGEVGEWQPDRITFVDSDGAIEWSPATDFVHYVRREDILGRALVAFWPVWPFRWGFYR